MVKNLKNHLAFAFSEYPRKRLKYKSTRKPFWHFNPNFSQMNLLGPKKADSKLLSVWWFVVLIVILVGIVGGTLLFYSSKIDMRLLEGEILSSRIMDCIVDNGYISEDFLENKLDIFNNCGISQDIINKSSNYYLNIAVYDFNSNLIIEKSYGNRAFVQECKVGAAMVKAKNFPKCIQKSTNVLNSEGELLKLNITAGSNSEYKLE